MPKHKTMAPDERTIAAIATPPGIGGVCVIRISGPDALAIAEIVSGKRPQPRMATVTRFRDRQGAAIDQGILLYFKAPHSFTGEDVVEFQGHGGLAVTQALLTAALDAGARLAEPGEFSRRAFLNDKMDLAQAEAVADLIAARSQAAVKAANRSLQGIFSARIETLAADLLELRSYIEAALDFPEEEIDFLSAGDVETRLLAWGEQLGTLLTSSRQGALINDGVDLVLAGKPNAGKSSLLNALLDDERAIVTAQAGTTRDILRESLVIAGIPINLLDTAGLRESVNPVEQEGIRRSHKAISAADIVLLLVDGRSLDGAKEKQAIARMTSEFRRTSPQAHVLLVYTKSDLVDPAMCKIHGDGVWISAKKRQGLDGLQHRIARLAGKEEMRESVFIARERHVRALQESYRHYQDALAQLRGDRAGELLAEDLRLAHESLGEIIGKVGTEALLGEIFSGFCIGK